MRYRYLAVFLISLVISLPVVFADQLSVAKISGNDGVDGSVREEDSLVIDVEAQIEGDEAITPTQVKKCVENTCVPFQQCTPNENKFLCRYTESKKQRLPVETATIRLFNDNGEVVSEASATATADSLAPVINQFALDPQFPRETTNIILRAEDYANKQGDIGTCSGIKEVRVYTKDGKRIAALQPEQQNQCTLQKTISYAHEQSEATSICAEATDNFGQTTGQVCEAVQFDKDKPEIKQEGFFDETGNKYAHVTSAGKYLSLGIEIEDNSELKYVRVDLSQLTGKPNDVQEGRLAGERYVWPSIFARPNQQCTVNLEAEDEVGNLLKKEINCHFEIDETPPEPLQITTNFQSDEGANLLGGKGQVIAKFREEGIGLAQGNVFLDLREIGGEVQAKPDNCELKSRQPLVGDELANQGSTSEGLWECTWNVEPNIQEGDYRIALHENAQDDLGNRAAKRIEAKITVIPEAPLITEIKHLPKSPIVTDTLTLYITVQGAKNEPFITADFSAVSEEKPKKALCEKSGTYYDCQATASSLKSGKGIVKLVSEDELGNKQTVEYKIEIYEPEPAEGVDYYRVKTVVVQPSQIDKKTAELVTFPLTVQPVLGTKYDDVQIIDKFVRCDDTYLSEGAELLNQETDQPIINLKLHPEVSELEKLEINCELGLRIRQGNRVFTKPEIEKIKVQVPIAGSQFGTFDESVQDKLVSVEQRINSLKRDIKRLEKLSEVANTIASYTVVVAVLDSIVVLFLTVIWAILFVFSVSNIPLVSQAAKVLWELFCPGPTYIHWIVSLAVWMPGAPMIPPIPTTADLHKFVLLMQSCMICNYESSLSGYVNEATGGLVVDVVGKVGQLGILRKTEELGLRTLGEDVAVKKGKPTALERILLNKWEPYQSIHTAKACMCVPAIIYNMRKERQVNCIYRNCIRESAKKGLPLVGCEIGLKAQNCLYVDSASWKLIGGSAFAHQLELLTQVIINKLPIFLLGNSWRSLCHPAINFINAYLCVPAPEANHMLISCGMWGVTASIFETSTFASIIGKEPLGLDRYTSVLEGNDYCR